MRRIEYVVNDTLAAGQYVYQAQLPQGTTYISAVVERFDWESITPTDGPYDLYMGFTAIDKDDSAKTWLGGVGTKVGRADFSKMRPGHVNFWTTGKVFCPPTTTDVVLNLDLTMGLPVVLHLDVA